MQANQGEQKGAQVGAATSKIHAGMCGLVTTVTAMSEDGQHVAFRVENVCKLAEHLGPVDAYAETGAGFEGVVHSAVREHVKGCCTGCVLPPGVFKAMQVAAGPALPQTASIELEKQGESSRMAPVPAEGSFSVAS